jgi:hypothetical protein
MKVFVDNDIAVKFAQWGLLGRFTMHLTKQGAAQLFGLSTLKYKFKLKEPDRAAAMLGSMDAVKQLTAFVSVCEPARAHNKAVAAALTDVPNIDAGEVALFAAAAHFDAVLVDTGDKRALRALGTLGPTHAAPQALAGKLACLEQTMQYLVGRWTWEQVRDAVSRAPDADKSTHRTFQASTQAAALADLRGQVEQLRTQCGGTLGVTPFAWIS